MNKHLIERKPYMQMLRNLKEQPVIKVITGMRRSGKSTLLEMLATEIGQTVKKEQIQFLNFEDLDTLAIGNFLQIYKHISLRHILPFSFAEYTSLVTNPQNFIKNESYADFWKTNPFNFTKDELLIDYIYKGSMPQAINMRNTVPEQENDYVKAILNSIIEKDIYKRRIIYNKPTFNKIVDFLFDSIGSYVSPNSIANTLKNEKIIIDNETVSNYLNYLSESFLLYKVPRYDVKGKNLLKTLDKYYLADTGFRQARLGKKMTEDRGHLLENMVYLELRRRNSEVYVGKLRDKEIDFVAIDNKGYVSYYQVAYTVIDEKTLERELAPLQLIRDANPKYLLSADWDTNPVYDGIRKYNVIDWMMDNTSRFYG